MKRFNHLLVLFFVCFAGTSIAQSDSLCVRDTVNLVPFKKKEVVKYGDIITYTGHIHGSVGEQFTVDFEENGVLRFVDVEIDYEQDQSQGLSGGDGAWKTFIFQATNIGESTITIQEVFRGEVMSERSITVVVVKEIKN